jgi:hypothetical protein
MGSKRRSKQTGGPTAKKQKKVGVGALALVVLCYM